MKNIVTILCLFLCVSAGFAQDVVSVPVDTSWKSGGFVNINTSQVGLSNWAAGGENTFAFGSSLILFMNYAKGRTEWNNTLNLGYAMLQTGSSVRKSDDKIDFVTKYGKRTSDHWFMTLLGNFKSQFANGFIYP